LVASSGYFLCGCHPNEKRHYSGDVVNGVYTDRRFDSQGFEVCPEHGERLYGFASVPTSDEAGFRPDFRYKSRHALSNLTVDYEDRRDNRDPEEVYAERQREKAQLSNGHG